MTRSILKPRLSIVLAILLIPAATPSQAGWAVGVSLGGPVYPRCYHPYHYYRPFVVVSPPPVYVQPAVQVVPAPLPVTCVPATTVVAPSTSHAPPSLPAPQESAPDPEVERYQRLLQSVEPRERAEAVMQLGRLRSPGSQGAVTATLTNDRSPQVREAAARALGLFGSADSLDALQRAAQADEVPEVRHSASYAADVIRTNLSRR